MVMVCVTVRNGKYIVVWIGCVDVLVCVFFFFFFKQKTAYEIVDCDWSSDVCSSDLLTEANHTGVVEIDMANLESRLSGL